jgi:hypothetical protein
MRFYNDAVSRNLSDARETILRACRRHGITPTLTRPHQGGGKYLVSQSTLPESDEPL